MRLLALLCMFSAIFVWIGASTSRSNTTQAIGYLLMIGLTLAGFWCLTTWVESMQPVETVR